MGKLVKEAGLNNEIYVDSAGTYSGHAGDLPDSRMRSAAWNRGYKLNHLARQFKREDFEEFDIIVVMDKSNYNNIIRLAPNNAAKSKVHEMISFCNDNLGYDVVPDPYYGGTKGFDTVLDLLEDGCYRLLEIIKQKL